MAQLQLFQASATMVSLRLGCPIAKQRHVHATCVGVKTLSVMMSVHPHSSNLPFPSWWDHWIIGSVQKARPNHLAEDGPKGICLAVEADPQFQPETEGTAPMLKQPKRRLPQARRPRLQDWRLEALKALRIRIRFLG